MKYGSYSIRAEIGLAKKKWGDLQAEKRKQLRSLLNRYRLSIRLGDLLQIEGRWYVTHAGLLRLAERRRCAGIRVSQIYQFCDPTICRWVFKATVYKTPCSKGFVGYGDADPTNVSSRVHGAEMRVAETRAVNRALRKAYGIGLCSVEELGWPTSRTNQADIHNTPASTSSDGHSPNGQARLRDRFSLLIRQHQLDPNLVKAYGANFCGTSSLRLANREQIEAFLSHLAERAKKDRERLVCQLNSYSRPQEGTP